jgi:protein-L-isoaspartate O-methyltransferase
MAERLNFGPGEMIYDPILAAEHLCRYRSVKSICRGKSVLDVACGDGYGSRLMADWGASSVIGIDISTEAIKRARQLFTSPKVQYSVGDVCAPKLQGIGNKKFDIICSFETIEHLDDPIPFLRNLAKWRRPGGVVVLSAPNDTVFAAEVPNPFHKTRYNFESFKEQAESTLGKASSWLMGTPAQGVTLVPVPNVSEISAAPDINAALDGSDGDALHWIPSLASLSAAPENSTFWVGVWGELDARNLVASPMSMVGFIEPWKALDWYKEEVDKKNRILTKNDASLIVLRNENIQLQADLRRRDIVLAEERRIALADRRRINELTMQVENGVKLTETARHDLAREVMFERQRWGLPYKIKQAVKGFVRR